MKNQVFRISILFLSLLLWTQCRTPRFTGQLAKVNRENEMLTDRIDNLERDITNMVNSISLKNAVPGKKYVQCYGATRFETVKSPLYPIYTGSNYEQDGIKKRRIKVAESYGNWKIKRPTEACPNASEEDDQYCIIWDYEESPAIFEEVYLVRDTNRIKEFEMTSFDVRTVVKTGTRSRARGLDCNSFNHSVEVFLRFNGKIQAALRKNGYKFIGASENQIDAGTKAALVDFQKKNGLPVGQLDFETLKALGIKR